MTPGLKMTIRRQRVLEIILAAATPIDAEEAWRRLEAAGRPVDRSSVYRALRYLVASGALMDRGIVDRSRLYSAPPLRPTSGIAGSLSLPG